MADDVQTPEVPATPAPVVEAAPVATPAPVEAPVAATVAPATVLGKIEELPADALAVVKAELDHVFQGFEHSTLMEGVSRLYALVKRVL